MQPDAISYSSVISGCTEEAELGYAQSWSDRFMISRPLLPPTARNPPVQPRYWQRNRNRNRHAAIVNDHLGPSKVLHTSSHCSSFYCTVNIPILLIQTSSWERGSAGGVDLLEQHACFCPMLGPEIHDFANFIGQCFSHVSVCLVFA